MKILVIQLRRIGDIILTTPVISYLKRAFPDAQIDFLCEPMGKDVLETHPDIRTVHLYDKSKPLAEILKVRREKYDVVFDFLTNPRSAYITGFSGARYRVGFNKTFRSLFYNVAMSGPGFPEYISKGKLRLVRYFLEKSGHDIPIANPDDHVPRAYLNQDDHSFAKQWLQRQQLQGKDFIVMVPIHRHPIRQWRSEGFREVGLELKRKTGSRIFLSCAPGEETSIANLRKGHESDLEIIPAAPFRKIAAIFSYARLVLTNDSGSMHFAVAVGTPTLTIYGPTRPIDCNPTLGEMELKNLKHVSLSAEGVPCLGCLKLLCPVGHLCMTQLQEATVIKTAEHLLTA